jgi:hypothetical protein
MLKKIILSPAGDHWSFSPNCHDKLLPIQEHIPNMGSRRIPPPSTACRQEIEVLFEAIHPSLGVWLPNKSYV